MRIVFWGKGNRGISCLRSLHEAGRSVTLVVVHPGDERTGQSSVGAYARSIGIPTIAPDDPNDQETRTLFARESADVFVLGGYGKILRQEVIGLPHRMCINLHGGKLPECRGSSPMNWALIRGEPSFTLSIIRVASGVDTGDVILDRTFPISADDTITDLHAIAEREFPVILLASLDAIARGTATFRVQDPARAAYFPLRFPDDGFILWDQLTAQEVHNRIRALTRPYPCAFTFIAGRKVLLVRSEIAASPIHGEPGRIYRITERGVLVCAADRCLWVAEAVFADSGAPLAAAVQRYDCMATLRGAALDAYTSTARVSVAERKLIAPLASATR